MYAILLAEFVYLLWNILHTHTMKHICLLFLSVWILSSCTVRRQGRETIDFTRDWRFLLSDTAAASDPAFVDTTWRLLDLPHDWSIESDFSDTFPATPSGGALPGGIAWYRKTFILEKSCEGKCAYIEFDGIYRNSKVWINGHLLGERPNGYSSFRYDMTPYVKIGEPNVLAVRVDNSQQPNSRWYSGSGIYRNVRLVLTYPVHVDQWGICVTTPVATTVDARVEVSTTILNKLSENETVRVEQTLVDQKGREVGTADGSVNVASSGRTVFRQSFRVDKPKLWKTSDPNMYNLITRLFVEGKQTDEYVTPVGIRTFRFDSEKGFILNGMRLKINGVCLHHDMGALGSAVNSAAIKRQLKLLKEMGCNAIRTSHNPPAPELLDLCDQMGFLVMDEAFDGWAKPKTMFDYSKDFGKWSDRDLSDLILRDRNHPSIVLWSIGNEVGEQWPQGDAEASAKLTRHLAERILNLDTSRPITAGCNETGSGNPLLKSGTLDVIGFNYHQNEFADVRKRFPGKAFIATESVSALMSRGYYTQPSTEELLWPEHWDKPFSHPSQQCSSYDQCHAPWGSTHEQTWKIVKKYPHIAGQFIWTGFDYLGEPTPYGWPSRSSFFGIIDLAGFPKDVYYMYQSEWTNKDVLHIFPHWNWTKGERIDVWAYYNHADEVELYLNGKSLGKRSKKGDDLHVMWKVDFEPGTLKAVSRKKGKVVLVREVKTAGEAASIRLTPNTKKLLANGKDLCYVTVELLDKSGTVLPLADNEVAFQIEGDGRIVGTDNGNPNDHTSLKLHKRKLFNGKCVVIVQTTEETGAIKLKATISKLLAAKLQVVSK
jgi:beta-galactosidase